MSLEAFNAALNKAVGVAGFIYAILKEDVDVFPARAGNALLSAPITPMTGKVFVKIPIAAAAGKNKWSTVRDGDVDSGINNITGEFVVPGNDPEISAKLDAWQERELIIIVPELDGCEEDNPVLVVLGTKCAGAAAKVTQKNDGSKDYVITVNYRAAKLPAHHTGLAVAV